MAAVPARKQTRHCQRATLIGLAVHLRRPRVRLGWKADISAVIFGMRTAVFRTALTALFLLCGCVSVPLAEPDAVLTETQTVDLMKHPKRWIGRTIALRVYPYDNGHAETEGQEQSYVACLERCDAARADRSIFLIYTRSNRFKGYRGDRAEVLKAVFGKVCPDWMPVCLDAPIRVFVLTERN